MLLHQQGLGLDAQEIHEFEREGFMVLNGRA